MCIIGMNEVVGMERPMVQWVSRCYVEVPQTSCILAGLKSLARRTELL